MSACQIMSRCAGEEADKIDRTEHTVLETWRNATFPIKDIWLLC